MLSARLRPPDASTASTTPGAVSQSMVSTPPRIQHQAVDTLSRSAKCPRWPTDTDPLP